MKKILLNILTHGDEIIGMKVLDVLKQKHPSLIGNGLDVQIANEEAYKAKKRFIELDLNRAFPGKADGVFEERRACKIAAHISEYDVVLDIHSTESGAKDMLIITRLDEPTKAVIGAISPKYLLYMDMLPNTSLISSAQGVGLAFEMGSDADEETVHKTVQGIERVLSHFSILPDSGAKPLASSTEYFRVFTPVQKPQGAQLLSSIKNFILVKKGQTYATLEGRDLVAEFDFYPVIFGASNYETIFGFAAEKIN